MFVLRRVLRVTQDVEIQDIKQRFCTMYYLCKLKVFNVGVKCKETGADLPETPYMDVYCDITHKLRDLPISVRER